MRQLLLLQCSIDRMRAAALTQVRVRNFISGKPGAPPVGMVYKSLSLNHREARKSAPGPGLALPLA